MHYSIKIYARIGELVQGILPDGNDFLVSGLPSETLCTEAILEEGCAQEPLPPKTRQAITCFLKAYAGNKTNPLSGRSIRLQSNIPPGKGLSGSSTDVLSVLCLLNDYFQTNCCPDDLYRIAADVEPTDPCLSDGIVVFRQRTGVTLAEIRLPPLSLIYFDGAPGWQTDTMGVERRYPPDAPQRYNELLYLFMRAAVERDYPALLDCVTRSAEYNQSILPLPRFDDYYRMAMDQQAGLMIAHSGTIVGWLVRPEEADRLSEKIERMDLPAPVFRERYFPPSMSNYA